MTIDFGSIKEYYPNRGFGFIGRTFSNQNGKVFFHIKKIKRKHVELAKKIDNSEAFDTFNFWYETKITEKGEQANKLWLSAENIPKDYTQELSALIQKVESIWKNIDSPKPNWLDFVTIELVGVDRKHELSIERDNLESQFRAAEEQRRRRAETLRENKIEKIVDKYLLTREEANELLQLLTEMLPKNFTHSKELSGYIVKHKLGYKYPNISGIVRMEEDGSEWDFHGGFPTNIYRIICFELRLSNQNTSARPVGFTPFNNLWETNQKY